MKLINPKGLEHIKVTIGDKQMILIDAATVEEIPTVEAIPVLESEIQHWVEVRPRHPIWRCSGCGSYNNSAAARCPECMAYMGGIINATN